MLLLKLWSKTNQFVVNRHCNLPARWDCHRLCDLRVHTLARWNARRGLAGLKVFLGRDGDLEISILEHSCSESAIASFREGRMFWSVRGKFHLTPLRDIRGAVVGRFVASSESQCTTSE